MNYPKKKKSDFWRVPEAAVYYGIVSTIVRLILIEGFSFPRNYAFIFAVLFAMLTAYPLFVRGTINRWTADKREWTFALYAPLVVIAAISASLFVELFILLIDEK